MEAATVETTEPVAPTNPLLGEAPPSQGGPIEEGSASISMPPSMGLSPLRQTVGPNSLLTADGSRHMRQRKLLLPPFHGEAIAKYTEQIAETAEREVATWKAGDEFPLSKRMQAVTLEVIMNGIFGIEGEP